MSTAELTGTPPRAPGGAREAQLGAEAAAIGRFPAVLTTALLLVVLYAAFEHGAVSLAVEARIQVVIAALAAAAGAALLWTGSLRLAAPRLALAGMALLAAFACWNAITLAWSVAPNQSWIEFNRAIAYVITLCLAFALGASSVRSLRHVASGYLLVALAVSLYALGQKVFPGLHVGGLFNLNQTGPLPRLQEPLGYWNALALLIVMAGPVALAIASDGTRPSRIRIAALCAIELMVLVIALTYSRGGLLALVAALAVGIALGGERLRSLMWLALAVVATVPPLVFGLEAHALTTAGVSLGRRETGGAEFGLVLLASLAVLVIVARRLLAVERRIEIGADRAPAARRLAVAAAALAVAAALATASLSSRGFTGTFSHAWHTFASTRTTSNTNPGHLLSADSQNRWVWWKEAANAFSDRPVGGWGAGSFGVVHLRYRRNSLAVQQPHSVPLQFLVETGIVGALLAVGGFILVAAVAGGLARRLPHGPERLLAAALFAAVTAYGIHALYDWDWDIPAVTLPVLLFLGVLAGARQRAHAAAGRRRSATARTFALGSLTVWLCAFALSAVLPSWAASKASSALVEASSTAPAALSGAESTARLASDLDPLSDAGLRVQATIAVHRGRLPLARAYLRRAVRRDPSDVQAWADLGQVLALRGDSGGADHAARRLLELDPHGPWVPASERSRLATESRAASGAVQTPPAAK